MQTLTDKPTNSPASGASEQQFSESRQRAPRRPVSLVASFRRHMGLLWPIPVLAVYMKWTMNSHSRDYLALVTILTWPVTLGTVILVPVNLFKMKHRISRDRSA